MAEAESKSELPSPGGDEFGDVRDEHFKAPEKVDLSTMLAKDSEDAALARYKASLLGQAAQASTLAADRETRRKLLYAKQTTDTYF